MPMAYILFSLLAYLVLTVSNLVTSKQAVPFRVRLAQGIIETAFSVKPLWKLASSKAREGIIKNGASMGVNWNERVQYYDENKAKLEDLYGKLVDKAVDLPDYYLKPFHAYDEGNLSWQVASEVEAAALTVHSNIFTPDRKIFELEGDAKLRENFHACMKSALGEKLFKPKQVIDLGCSTGLSTLKLASTFPDAQIFGMDLSVYMLSVGEFDLQHRPQLSQARKAITYLHGKAEALPFGTGAGPDLVSMCLVSHELPSFATASVFQEVFRVLPSGGAFSFMDINPNSESFRRLASNPFAFQAFKSTEPWLAEYITVPLQQELANIGFVDVSTRENSPRHQTIVAWKP